MGKEKKRMRKKSQEINNIYKPSKKIKRMETKLKR